MIYVFATTDISGTKDILMGIFISLTQGILVAGCSVYFNQIYKQLKEERRNDGKWNNRSNRN